jgi:hypothetical protein
MRLSKRTLPFAVAASMAFASLAGSAAAEETVRVARPADRSTTTGPNRELMRSGLWTLGLSYVPAVIVAVESPVPADDKLFIPVAGPWMDYATRDCSECKHESTNKVLLVTDGIVQGIGALQILGSFLFLETRPSSAHNSATRTAKSGIKLAPARFAGAYGLTAQGSFSAL